MRRVFLGFWRTTHQAVRVLPPHISSAVAAGDFDFVTAALSDGLTSGSLLLSRHPLGFLDVMAADTIGATRTARRSTAIHVWHPRYAYPELNPPSCHSHGWELASTVLAGRLVDTRYGAVGNPNGSHLAYSVDYAPASSWVAATGFHFTVEPTAQHVFEPGDVYQMRADEFHDTHDGNEITITALCRGPQFGPAVALYPERIGAARRYHRDAIHADHAQHAITDILSVLKGV